MRRKKSILKRIITYSTISAFTLAALLLLMDRLVMPFYTRSGSVTEVPHVVGMTLEEAEKLLQDAGLTPHKSDERFDQRYPKGSIVLQNPPPEAVVKYGRRIHLIVSSGEQLVEVPPVRGRSVREARFTLERHGLGVGEITYEESNLYPANTVIAQESPAGSEIPRGSSINLRVSHGAIQDAVMVPELVGKTLIEAQRLLNQVGLRVGKITYQPISDLLPNTVVQQYPHPGDRIPRTQNVDLFISEEPPVDAEDIIEGGGGT